MAMGQTTGETAALKAPHLLYCWELGQGYGHVLNFRNLARQLLAAGWRLSAVVAEPDKVRRMLPGEVQVLPMPALRPSRLYDPTVNLAEILLNNDFADPLRLQERLRQWDAVLGRLSADVLLIDHAPTALLAAHLRKDRHALIGTGFFIPPDLAKLPPFSPFRDRESNAEQTLLQVIAKVQLAGRTTKLASLAALFQQADEQLLCTFPELDHYGARAGDYWGAVFDFGYGEAPHWPAKAGPKVFAYLHHDYPELERVLHQLSQLPLNVLVHVGGWHGDPARWPALCFSREPLQLRQVAAQARLVICHAGHATLAGMLLAQVPLLLLPKQLEQLILSERLWQQQLALFLPLAGDFSLLPTMIETLLQEQGLSLRLQAFAGLYQGFSSEEQTEGMLEALTDLCGADAGQSDWGPPV